MPVYLAVPQAQRERLIHEKARYAQRGEIRWVRSYLSDDLDDLELNGEAPATRLVAHLFPRLAARTGWIVPDDFRRVAGMLELRPQETRHALDRLVELGRIERISGVVETPRGDLQLPLERPSQGRASVEQTPEPGRSQVQVDLTATAGSFAQRSATDDETASQRLARARGAEQSREEEGFKAKQASTVNGARAALPDDAKTGEIRRRAVALACRGDQASASFVRSECERYPERVVARALESLMGRRPKPANPAGYLVNAMRSIARDEGIERATATIEREPEL